MNPLFTVLSAGPGRDLKLPRGWRFEFRPWITLGVTLGIMIMVGLGFWQLDRAAQKAAVLALQQERAGAPPLTRLPPIPTVMDLRFRKVALSGQFDTQHSLWRDNRIHQGQAGYGLFTPLRLADGKAILVDRGWFPLGPSRNRLPPLPTTFGTQRITGVLDRPHSPGLRLGTEAEVTSWPRRVSSINLEHLAADFAYPLAPLILRADTASAAGAVARPPAPTFGPQRHIAYALQWFGLALALLVIFCIIHLRRSGHARPHH